MAQETLLEKLEEAASKARSLEGEKTEAVARIQALEREAEELKETISLAESKADEMLKENPAPDTSSEPVTHKADTTGVPLASKGLEELVEPSNSRKDKPKRHSPRAVSLD